MKLFVYEYVSCQRDELPASLRREGAAMLAAVLADAVRLPGAAVATLVAVDGLPAPAEVICQQLSPGQNEQAAFHELSRVADFTLAIAPETGGLLRERHDWVVQAGGAWLGCSAPAIDLTTDKLAMAKHLQEAGISTPASRLLGDSVPASFFPVVHKPRDGAGSQATFLARDAHKLATGRATVREEGWQGQAIVQKYAAGQPASVALLIGSGHSVPLLPAAQLLSDDGRFRYLGGRIPLPAELAARAVRLAVRAAGTVDGLLGYVGVDLVLGESADATGDQIIEINPRLTTSYVGLRALTADNLLSAMLNLCRGQCTPLTWQPGAVDFDAGGNVRNAGVIHR